MKHLLWGLAVLLGGCCSHDHPDTGPGRDTGTLDRIKIPDQKITADQKIAPDQKITADQTADQKTIADQKTMADQKTIADQKVTPDQTTPDQKTTPDQTAMLDQALAPDLGTKVPGIWKTIPAGSFKMGSPLSDKCRYTNEPLQIPVTLSNSFQMQSTEVTQAQFTAVMGYGPSVFKACGGSCPVENVNWHEAVAYCNALSALAGLASCYSCSGSAKGVTCQETTGAAGKGIYACKGYRLPTEAEWEYAYRAGTTSALYNGAITSCSGKDANADKLGWYYENSGSKTHPVGQKLANAWGLSDMAGNVEEWCHDWYQTNLGSTAQTNPVGATSSQRALRSGSWKGFAYLLRGAVRYGQPPVTRAHNMGFRCVRSLP